MTVMHIAHRGFTAAALLSVLMFSGCQLDNAAVSFSCTEAVLTADRAQATADNTGSNEESGFIRIRDGSGTLLFETPYGPGSVGTSIGMVNAPYPYTTAPATNPLVLTITSPAGGALAVDREWYRFTGTCPGLPTATVAAVPTLSLWTLIALGGLLPALATFRRGRRRD